MEKLHYRSKDGYEIIGQEWKNDAGAIIGVGFITDGLESFIGRELCVRLLINKGMPLKELRAVAYAIAGSIVNDIDQGCAEIRCYGTVENGMMANLVTSWAAKVTITAIPRDIFQLAMAEKKDEYEWLVKKNFAKSPQFDKGVPFDWSALFIKKIVERGDTSKVSKYLDEARKLFATK